MPQQPLSEFLLSLADDEFILGHRASEWTGHAPILEEDIAFSNIAQDEIGHSLVWYTLLQEHNGLTPDHMGFVRSWTDFRCCRFVTYKNGDFAHAVVRQYLFDEAETVRLTALKASSNGTIASAAGKILPEEGYHLRHTKGLLERLGDATPESHQRMQGAVDMCFPQSLGMFERLIHEKELVASGIFPGNDELKQRWLSVVVPVLKGASLAPPVDGSGAPTCIPDDGGRIGKHAPDLQQAVKDIQLVMQTDPGATW